MISQLVTEPGYGGILVLVVLVVGAIFYGSLVLWTASAPEEEDRPGEVRG